VVSTAVLRKAKGLTIQSVCDHMREEHGMDVDRGTISAIENGHRGGSAKMLAAYADALGIPVPTSPPRRVVRRITKAPHPARGEGPPTTKGRFDV
jgi:transcriptional regulator with XRE-family HTH domain